jgi:hypothetical protein
MYVIKGSRIIQCDELMNLFDEKGIQYNYLDMTEVPNKTMTYLRMHCNSFPIVLHIKHSFRTSKIPYHILITFELFLFFICILLFYYYYYYYSLLF